MQTETRGTLRTQIDIWRVTDRLLVEAPGSREHAGALDLSGLSLKNVPAIPRELAGISRLNLSRNRLETIPEFIFEMTQIETLDLGSNWLRELPGGIGKLANLANKKSIEISGKGLLEAAKGIANVVPIAIEIVNTVRHFAGIT